MGYVANNLIRDEKIVFSTKFHWWLWASNIFYSACTVRLLIQAKMLRAIPSALPARALSRSQRVSVYWLGCLLG